MPKAPQTYRLVIFDEIDEPAFQEARDLFCKVIGIHPTDATQWLRRTPGTWPYPLDEAKTRLLLDGLYDIAVAAEAWQVDRFPNLGTPRSIHRAACLDDGLRIEGLRGEPTHWIPWDKVELICAGRIGISDEFRSTNPPRWPSAIVTGIRAIALRAPRPNDRRSRSQRIPRDPLGEVIVVRRDPRLAFRFHEDQMNYAYLGDRLAESSAENFPVFLADLCGRATCAYITPSTQAFLNDGDPAEFEFPSSQSLLDYATHRLLWSWYSRDRDRRNSQANDRPPGDHDDSDTEGYRSDEFTR